jgi:hypothetical protein
MASGTDDSRDPAVYNIHPQLTKWQMDSIMATAYKHWLLIVRDDDNAAECWRQNTVKLSRFYVCKRSALFFL